MYNSVWPTPMLIRIIWGKITDEEHVLISKLRNKGGSNTY